MNLLSVGHLRSVTFTACYHNEVVCIRDYFALFLRHHLLQCQMSSLVCIDQDGIL